MSATLATYIPTGIVARYADTDAGVEVRVARITLGYSVTVWDTDADMAFPEATIYPTIERADSAAREIAAKF